MSVPVTLLVATSNPHKLEELSRILTPEGIGVVGLDALTERIEPPVEDRPSFIGNAMLKARYYAERAGRPALADDSGLAVDALGGAPGVHSARYAGVEGPREEADAANNRKLLAELEDVPDEQRTARFVCVMAAAGPQQHWAAARGTVKGRILREPRGTNGFGYDPLFYVPQLGCTTAELPSERKDAVSHRGEAARRLVQLLHQLGVGRTADERHSVQ